MSDKKGTDVKLTGTDEGGKLDKILGAGSNPKNKLPVSLHMRKMQLDR